MIANGKVQTIPAATAVGPFAYNAALKYDGSGRIVVSTTAPVVAWTNGLPFAADGALCVSAA